jgi:hypothetical protein
MSTDLKNTFISHHNLPVHWGTCPIVSQAPENQQHKILWSIVGTRQWLPWSGESWSLPLNGLVKFPEDVTIGVGIYGLSSMLECSEQYAFMIPGDCEHHFPWGWCHLKLFFWQATQDVSTALTRALSRAGNHSSSVTIRAIISCPSS